MSIVPLDSYYNDTTGMTDEARKAINFDHPDAFDWRLLIEQVNDLRQGKAIEQPTYSYILGVTDCQRRSMSNRSQSSSSRVSWCSSTRSSGT